MTRCQEPCITRRRRPRPEFCRRRSELAAADGASWRGGAARRRGSERPAHQLGARTKTWRPYQVSPQQLCRSRRVSSCAPARIQGTPRFLDPNREHLICPIGQAILSAEAGMVQGQHAGTLSRCLQTTCFGRALSIRMRAPGFFDAHR